MRVNGLHRKLGHFDALNKLLLEVEIRTPIQDSSFVLKLQQSLSFS